MGREFDPETSLYYYRARYYDSAAGRFLSEDPAKSPANPNRYRYVRNSSPNRVDASGMTDQPAAPPMWGRYRGCKLVGVLSLTLWTSETNKTPTSDWYVVGAHQEGLEAPGEGVPWAVITCIWQRTYTAELWGHVLTTYTWRCWTSNCFGYSSFTTHTFEWSMKDLGKTTGTEQTTTHHIWFGAEDETNEILCATTPGWKP